MTIGYKPRTAAKSGSSKTKQTVAVQASDSDESHLSNRKSGDRDGDNDSSDGGSADHGDSDIAGLPEMKAQQVLNDEVILFHILLLVLTKQSYYRCLRMCRLFLTMTKMLKLQVLDLIAVGVTLRAQELHDPSHRSPRVCLIVNMV